MEDTWGKFDEEDNPYISDDDQWNSNDEYANDSMDMTAEVKAFERAGGGGAGGMFFNAKNKQLTRLDRANQDKGEQFAERLDAISRNLSSNVGVNISEDEISVMIQQSRRVSNVEHLNPTAYILGYLATKGGKSIKVDDVTRIITKILPFANTDSVQPPDVIRYARFWMNSV